MIYFGDAIGEPLGLILSRKMSQTLSDYLFSLARHHGRAVTETAAKM